MKQQSEVGHIAPLGRIILIPRQPLFAYAPAPLLCQSSTFGLYLFFCTLNDSGNIKILTEFHNVNA
jgi:hypothetical protein